MNFKSKDSKKLQKSGLSKVCMCSLKIFLGQFSPPLLHQKKKAENSLLRDCEENSGAVIPETNKL